MGSYPITAAVTGANIANYATVTVVPGTLAITPLATVTTVTTSASPVTQGASVTFTAAVTYGAGVPVTAATVNFYNGATPLCASTLNSSGVATCTTSTLPVGTLTITATYQATLDFASSSGTVAQVVNPGSFTLTAAPPTQFISGPGSTVYLVTVSSVQGFAGPVTLACSGLPADATCTFATPTVTLTGTGVGASVTTTMTVTTTLADARLTLPALPAPAGRTPNGLAPIAFAAVFPFGLVAFFGLSRRRRGHARAGPLAEPPPAPRALLHRRHHRPRRLRVPVQHQSGLHHPHYRHHHRQRSGCAIDLGLAHRGPGITRPVE